MYGEAKQYPRLPGVKDEDDEVFLWVVRMFLRYKIRVVFMSLPTDELNSSDDFD